MVITAAKLAFKVAKSKKARKIARKAVKFARENVSVDAANRRVEVAVAGRTVQLSRDSFKRDAAPAIASESNPFYDLHSDPYA